MHPTARMPQPGIVQQPTQQDEQILLGRYRVLATNAGGFGTVFTCWDSRLQRRVAIKRMPLRMGENSPAQSSTISEALAEARTSSMLAHPNIVTMFDFETDGYYSYLVMEYVDGLSLADLLSRVEGGVLTFDECAHLIRSIASALAYAHENGVLHLDIKPANIMINRSGVVKLADFGMASLASAAGYQGARGGTVGYMPPEQIEGDLVDERTDVFSLAVVVWEALTGSCPYEAQTPEQSLKLIRRGPSPALSRVEPDLAGIVEETLLQALDPLPAARLASVRDFARDIVPPLGDVQDGNDSLRELLNQTEETAEPDPKSDWDRLHVPVNVRLPWLGGLLVRAMAAATAGWASYQALPLLLPESSNAVTFGVGGIALSTAAWPPLGGIFGIGALITTICVHPSRLSLVFALAIGIIGFVWWIAFGRRYHTAGTSLLLPSCLGTPIAGVSLAGYSMGPVAAFFTTALGWLMWLTLLLGTRQGFETESLIKALGAALFSTSTLTLVGSASLAALICSVLTRRGRVVTGVLGQVLALGIVVGGYVAATHMENEDIVAALDPTTTAVAVTLGFIFCIAVILMGGRVQNTEGDDRS